MMTEAISNFFPTKVVANFDLKYLCQTAGTYTITSLRIVTFAVLKTETLTKFVESSCIIIPLANSV